MVKYAHRKNSCSDPLEYQALEIDLRSVSSWDEDTLVLGHDWNAHGPYFSSFLENCNSKTELAINIKSAGLAKTLFEEYKSKLDQLKSYFFFDMAIPDYLEFQKYFPHNTAKRVSEYEPYDNTGLMDWIWFDYFYTSYAWELIQLSLKPSKIVVVSPELHGYDLSYDPALLEECNVYGICTDRV